MKLHLALSFSLSFIQSVPAMVPETRSTEINKILSLPLKSLLSRERLKTHQRCQAGTLETSDLSESQISP